MYLHACAISFLSEHFPIHMHTHPASSLWPLVSCHGRGPCDAVMTLPSYEETFPANIPNFPNPFHCRSPLHTITPAPRCTCCRGPRTARTSAKTSRVLFTMGVAVLVVVDDKWFALGHRFFPQRSATDIRLDRSGRLIENELLTTSTREIAFMSSMGMQDGTSDTESTSESSVLELTMLCLCATCLSDHREKN